MSRTAVTLLVGSFVCASAALPATAETVPTCFGRTPTIVGSDELDRIVGTPRDDVIVGLGGWDEISGAGGNDWICGNVGWDHLTGGTGDDHIRGGGGNDVLDGYDDLLGVRGGEGNDVLRGGAASDTIFGLGGTNRLIGGIGSADGLVPGTGTDYVSGGDGDFDSVDYYVEPPPSGVRIDLAAGTTSGSVSHTLIGIEDVYGSPFADTIIGTSGPNRLWGAGADDALRGAGGDDTVLGGDGADRLYAGFGNDYLAGMDGNDTLYGGRGNDSFGRIISGGEAEYEEDAGSDVFFGEPGDDFIYAIDGVQGNDAADGGPDRDGCLLDLRDASVRCEE